MVGQVSNAVSSAYNNQFQKRVDDQAQSDRQRAAQEKAQAAFSTVKAEKSDQKKAAQETAANEQKPAPSPSRQRGSLFDQVV